MNTDLVTLKRELDALVDAKIAGLRREILKGQTYVLHAPKHAAGGQDTVGASSHPNLATHDALGLATDAELATHAAAADPHAVYVLESLIDAKGDIITATADNTPARLAVGTNAHVLTADSAQATGLKWAAAAGGGAALTVQEVDGAPLDAAVTVIRVPNTALTDNGVGDVTLAFPHGAIGVSGMVQLIVVRALGMVPRQTNPCASAQRIETVTNLVNYFVCDFDPATDEYATFELKMPLNWDVAVNLTVAFEWTCASGSGDVIWGIQMVAVTNDDPLDAAFSTAVLVTDTVLAVGDLHLTPATAGFVPAGALTAGDHLFCQVYRDANAAGDTLVADARLIGLRIHYGVLSLST